MPVLPLVGSISTLWKTTHMESKISANQDPSNLNFLVKSLQKVLAIKQLISMNKTARCTSITFKIANKGQHIMIHGRRGEVF